MHVQVVDTTEREGDGAWRCTQVTEPTLSDYSWSRGVCVWRERGEEKREEQKEVQRDGGEERSFEPLPPCCLTPLQTEPEL